MTPNIHEFVKEALAKKVPKKDIKAALLKAGWREDEVLQALGAFADIDFPVPVPKRKPYLSAQEAFMYLVLFLTLYISAISTGTLLFQFINQALPDPLTGPSVSWSLNTIRQAAASLIIAYPVFMLMTISLRRAISKDPEKRASKIRKWLTYITLFIAAGIIIGDLISLVFNLLNGDLTLRFVLKVLSIGLIAGTIFGFYLWDIRKEERSGRQKFSGTKLLAIIVTSTVALLIIIALVLAGSPGNERLRRLDDRRVQDLQELRYGAIESFYQEHGTLPGSLEELRASASIPNTSFADPATGEPYDYTRMASSTFELCAVFDMPSGKDAMNDVPLWEHGIGRSCFKLDVRTYAKPPLRIPEP